MIDHPHRGDIWWAQIPGDKRRPVLVLSRERFIPRLNAVLVAPITTRVRDIPTEIALGAEQGLPRACAANFDNLLTLPKRLLDERVSRIDGDLLAAACRAYRFAADCG